MNMAMARRVLKLKRSKDLAAGIRARYTITTDREACLLRNPNLSPLHGKAVVIRTCAPPNGQSASFVWPYDVGLA